jgi:hypothetical protein
VVPTPPLDPWTTDVAQFAPLVPLGMKPRVSIVITNYNYRRFLGIALSSALGQREAAVEVIVVDDGSTDGSRDLIAGHDGTFQVILQENLGQTAAMNAGFAAATGDAVLFLDSDDELRPGAAAAVAEAFAAHPEAARVVFRLEIVDAAGRPSGAVVPSADMPLPHGDVRAAVLAYPDDLPWPPTSGNAFASWALERLFPLPVDDDLAQADAWLHPLTPLLGSVVALPGIGGSYRLHGGNVHVRERLDVARSRALISRNEQVHRELDRVARSLGYGGARPRSVTAAAHRLVSLRLGGPGHPISHDTRRRALAAGLGASFGHKDVSLLRRAAYATWFTAVAIAPAPAVRLLAEAAFEPVRRRGRLVRFVVGR